ncbi:MAG: adenylate/guanylate cyclase domain-containing protein [Snowella sp.]|nr:adenylate/guanylate cyclase domain-containing protein [Snowella sp.]
MLDSLWTKVKPFFWRSRGVWIATPTVAGLVILLRLSGILQGWEWTTYDLYLRLRPPETSDRRIGIVGIDENDVRHLQGSIIPDGILADLLEKLIAMKPRAIGLDIYRDLPVPPGQDKLLKIFKDTPNLVGIQKVAGEAGRETVAASSILKAKGQVGANDLPIDADNRVRRGFFYLSDGKDNVYSFALHLAGHYLAKEQISPELLPNSDHWKMGKAVFVPLENNDGSYVWADTRGFQLLINYRGGNKFFDTVSMTDILENRVSPDWGRDRVILIGKVGESFKDVFFTPYSSVFGLAQGIPGVEIHATLTSQIIGAALESRPLIQSWSEPTEWLWILAWSGIGATISWQFRYVSGSRKKSWVRWGLVLLSMGTLFGSTYGALILGWWLPVIPPFLALLGSAIAITAYIARTGVEIRKTFGRYLTDAVVANLLENPSGLSLGGERRKITILTSDLRGFTANSERLSPEEVIKILNFYLGHMAEVITKYQGTIDEFMGDGILVLFGAPTYQEDDAQRAVACAIEMQLAMIPVNQQMKAWGLAPLAMGIGINTGEVVVGNIGSEKRTKYGIVGNHVNLTYRIESYTTGGQILISESTYQEAGEGVIVQGSKIVQPKGIQNPITIYDIGGMKHPFNLQLTQEAEQFFPLPEALPIQYCLLEEKHISQQLFHGKLVKLSEKGAEVEAETHPPALTNLKINLLTTDTEKSEDIYAKVVDQSAQSGKFYVYFTAKPPIIAQKFNDLYQRLQN